MYPAYSVIFFTVSSGIGYGLLALMGIFAATGGLPLTKDLGLVGLGLGFISVSAGLLSSTFHLGHPERAWRALTQWKSSWLSREGIAAVLTFLPVILLAYTWVYRGDSARTLEIWAVLTAAGAFITVYCTGMIYRSLKTIHQWHNAWTLPNYLLLGLAGGAVWLSAIVAMLGYESHQVTLTAALALAAAWISKAGYWRFIDTTRHQTTPETATGLGRFGKVSKFEGPHTSPNYLMKEMGFQVARKHVAKLRRYVHLIGFAAPLGLVVLGLIFPGIVGTVSLFLAGLAVTLGLVIERWLFFAEASHVVSLYYGEKST
ncbi:MAG: dimethyl sulfoxide reductase anchor subunit [Rhodospirillaceae bacterium]|nr:dimethyl sulfoxide reductase anchor subunit [Rhodospirillaceae bacterium]